MATALELLKAGSTLSGTNSTWEYINNLGGGGSGVEFTLPLIGTIDVEYKLEGVLHLEHSLEGILEIEEISGTLEDIELTGTLEDTTIIGEIEDGN